MNVRLRALTSAVALVVFVEPGRADVTYLGSWGSMGTANGQFSFPHSLAASGTGIVYVADTVNSRIQVFDSSGNFLMAWGTPGGGNGPFMFPVEIAVDASENVYVADKDHHRVLKFGPPDETPVQMTSWGAIKNLPRPERGFRTRVAGALPRPSF